MTMSMTGFASQTFNIPLQEGALNITISLKTINGRFFEATYKMPYPLALLEADIAKKLKRELIRGTIFLTIYSSNIALLKGTIQPVLPLIKSYFDALNSIKETFGLHGSVEVRDLLLLPSIFETPEMPLDKKTEQAIITACDTVLSALIEDRLREGKALEADLNKRIIILKQELKKIEPRALEVLEARKEMLLKNLQQFLGGDNQEQYLAVIAQQLDKLDIHEEIVRFTTHLNNLEVVVNSQDREKGKKIDFIMQELLREINTLAAKCSDSDISTNAINIKVELEKAREQAQNIV
jgi:uncharacterized protein (TIGR00255 family)